MLNSLGTFRSDYDYEYEYEFFQCVPGAHARLREAVASTRSVVKISSPS